MHIFLLVERREQALNCKDCAYSDIADWEQDKETGKATPIYWCEKLKHLCDDIQECELKGENK